MSTRRTRGRGITGWRLERRRRRLARSGRTSRPKAMYGLLASLAVLSAAIVASFVLLQPEAPGTERSLTSLRSLQEDDRIERVTILDEDARVAGRLEDGRRFWTAFPRGDATGTRLIQELAADGVDVDVDPQTSKSVVRLLLTVLLPLMVLANLFALFFVSSRGGGTGLGEVVSFGTLSGRGGRRGTSNITFSDVAGLPEAVDELSEVVDYLAQPARYEAMDAAPPKGVLLFGPPGCGKTLLARAVAGEAGVPFFAVAGAEFVESLVGVGAARVRDLFSRVRSVAPAIVFIDELDAAGRRRGGGASGGGGDERDQTLNQLLVEMDGFEVTSGIVVMAATNRLDILDPALLRPGRFDRHITIDKPDIDRRRAIVELHARRKPLAGEVDFQRLARETPGFSGADLANVVNEAALLAIRESATTLSAPMFAEAVDRVRAGPRRRGHLLSEAEEYRLAVREAGRAIVLALTGGYDELHRISVVARATSAAVIARGEDATILTRAQLGERLVRALASRAAEELVLKDASTEGEADLATATSLAVDLVGRYGMSDTFGLRRVVGDADEGLPGSATILDVLAPDTHAAFDAEVSRVLAVAGQRARRLLEEQQPTLHRVIDRLMEAESVEPSELSLLLASPDEQAIPPPRPTARSRA